MGNSSTLSFRLEDDIIDRLDDAASDSRTSRSGLAREALLVGLEEMSNGEGEIDVPDHLGHDAKVRRMIAKNKAERRLGKFRSEFSKQLKTSFSNNETPGEFRQSVAGYIEEAEDLGEIPEEVRESMDSDALTYSEWVEEMIDYYAVAYEAQTFDHDPIDDPLGNHEGIENARQWVDRAENIAERAEGGSYRVGAHDLAQRALTDGVIPDHIEQKAEQHENGVLDGVVAAAQRTASNSALTSTDSEPSELE